MFTRRIVSAVATGGVTESEVPPPVESALAESPELPKKRAARIVSQTARGSDEIEREHLLSRILDSNGAGLITRAANAYRKHGFEFPEEQAVQLKLLEHTDEREVRGALGVLASLLEEQAPFQLPIFEQRLKRLEDDAEDSETREAAASLRRALRG